MTDSIRDLISDGGDCRTTSASPGLLNNNQPMAPFFMGETARDPGSTWRLVLVLQSAAPSPSGKRIISGPPGADPEKSPWNSRTCFLDGWFSLGSLLAPRMSLNSHFLHPFTGPSSGRTF